MKNGLLVLHDPCAAVCSLKRQDWPHGSGSPAQHAMAQGFRTACVAECLNMQGHIMTSAQRGRTGCVPVQLSS